MDLVRTRIRQRISATMLTLVVVASTTACGLAADALWDGCSDEDYEFAHQIQSLVEDATGSLCPRLSVIAREPGAGFVSRWCLRRPTTSTPLPTRSSASLAATHLSRSAVCTVGAS